MSPERLNELEKVAKAARWQTRSTDIVDDEILQRGNAIASKAFREAFNPATVLALLSEVRALRSALEALKDGRPCFCDLNIGAGPDSLIWHTPACMKAVTALSPSSTAKEPRP